MTTRSASRLPSRSEISTSTAAPVRSRTASTVCATCSAPPSGMSSRLTIVITAWRTPIFSTASATRRGSSASAASGSPRPTAQNVQRRVQISPRTMNVAVPACQHSKMFGQRASWQTVFSARSLISRETGSCCEVAGDADLEPFGTDAGAFVHAGVMRVAELRMLRDAPAPRDRRSTGSFHTPRRT